MKPLHKAQVILLMMTVGMGAIAVMLLTMIPSISAIQIAVGILFGLGVILVIYFLARAIGDSFDQSKKSARELTIQVAHDEESPSRASPNTDVAAASSETRENRFYLVGEYWRITFRGNEEFLLKDIKGLGYIALLLRKPFKPIASLELVSLGEGIPPDVDMTATECVNRFGTTLFGIY